MMMEKREFFHHHLSALLCSVLVRSVDVVKEIFKNFFLSQLAAHTHTQFQIPSNDLPCTISCQREMRERARERESERKGKIVREFSRKKFFKKLYRSFGKDTSLFGREIEIVCAGCWPRRLDGRV
jgi:hypothetical protein